MLKKIVSILLSLTVFFSLGLQVSAAVKDNEIRPNYLYTGDVTSSLIISNGTATCTSKLTGLKSVTSISGKQYLERKNGSKWEIVSGCSWSDSTYSTSLKMSNTKDNLESDTYRVRAVFTVYSGSSSETVEKTSREVTVK